MRCKSCDVQLMEHTPRRLLDAALCPECYHHSQDAILDYEFGLRAPVRPPDQYACRWEDKYVQYIPPDSDN
jgi:hypothetical protein